MTLPDPGITTGLTYRQRLVAILAAYRTAVHDLEAQVGADGSAVATSLEYRISALEGGLPPVEPDPGSGTADRRYGWTTNPGSSPNGTAFDVYPTDLVVPAYNLPTFSRLGIPIFTPADTLSFAMSPVPPSGATYEVRNHLGAVVASGAANVNPLILPTLPLGWYLISVFRPSAHVPTSGKKSWGLSMDGNSFCIVRSNPSLPPIPTLANYGPGRLRYSFLAGPERFSIDDAAHPDTHAGGQRYGYIDAVDVPLAQAAWTPFDIPRPKKLTTNFPYYMDRAKIRVNATGGTYSITVGGQTATVAHNATSSAVATALQALSTVGAGKADAEGGPANASDLTIYLHETTSGLSAFNATVSGAGLTGGTATATIYREGDGVITAVNALKHAVDVWEARNEPNIQGFPDGAKWAAHQLAFHAQVHGADPDAVVMGPCPVSISANSNSYTWLGGFFAAGGGAGCDAISVHPYPGWADLVPARKVWDDFVGLLTAYGQQGKQRWITEWGTFSAHVGIHEPMRQARWVLLAFMLWEQYGIPKERACYFYDEGGFLEYPSQWILSNAANATPALVIMRVRSEELLGKAFAERLDFGLVEDHFTLGSRFTGADGTSVLEIASSGCTDQVVEVDVSTTVGVQVVSPFGVVSAPTVNAAANVLLPIQNGVPTFLRLPSGVTASIVAPNYGTDLAVGKATFGTGPGTGRSKINDGVLRSWYIAETGDFRNDATAPYTNNTVASSRAITLTTTAGSTLVSSSDANFTAADEGLELGNAASGPSVVIGSVLSATQARMCGIVGATSTGTGASTITDHLPCEDGVDFATPTTINAVIVHCPGPWQGQSSLLDFDVDYWTGTAWVTIQTITEPKRTHEHVRSEVVANSQVDSYYSDRSVFILRFPAVTTTKFRIVVRDATLGGSVDPVVASLGGQFASQRVTLRCLSAYNVTA